MFLFSFVIISHGFDPYTAVTAFTGQFVVSYFQDIKLNSLMWHSNGHGQYFVVSMTNSFEPCMCVNVNVNVHVRIKSLQVEITSDRYDHVRQNAFLSCYCDNAVA